jgi:surface rod structure-forming protein G/rare lipoprotein A (RlpA)-like double-psi beta-barrel protein
MTVRVRRAGWTALVILAGASLLSRSMSFAFGGGRDDAASTVSLRVSADRAATASVLASGSPDQPAIWAVPAPAWFATAPADGDPSVQSVLATPDGIRPLAVKMAVGARRPLFMFTNAATLPVLLDAMGIRLHRLDQVRPRGLVNLYQGEVIQIIRMGRVVQTVTQPIPYATLIRYSNDLERGQVKIESPGRPGQIVITYRVTYRNGKEIGREILNVNVLSNPVSQVELHGTQAAGPNVQYGQASWYNMCSGMHAAHLTLPFGTVVTVRNLDNGKTVTVVINDRGPYGVPGRIIDLCEPAFAQIAPLGQGVARVEISW